MSSSQGNNYSNNDDKSNTIVAIVALVVSAIALIGTSLQVVQQYMASAAGYSSCDESVIGPWHTTKKRKFRLSEMRFRVLFKTPVFFVCAADNAKGPVKDSSVLFVKGDSDSIEHTLSLPLADAPLHEPGPKSASRPGDARPGDARHGAPAAAAAGMPLPVLPLGPSDEKGVHTADTEMSTWVRLLQELHRMERDSAQWQNDQAGRNPPENTNTFKDHKLCVALQAKQRSWDTMPASVGRPYATTTISHLVEMAAMLGIYWKEFDRSIGRYRAEGNGYVLTGSHVADLGIVFTFQICGKSKFRENRIIPVDEVKEFAFGLVPTIFRRGEDVRRLAFSTDDTHSLGLLLLGNRNELAETLVSIGCNTNTSNCLRNESMRHGHLFPLAFEIIGMLGRTLHTRKNLFRFLPNPTFYHWDKKYFSMRKLLQEYSCEIGRLQSAEAQIERLKEHARAVVGSLQRKPERRIADRAEDAADDVFDRALMNELHDKLDACDAFLTRKGRQDVELVLREHVQELLHMVNNEGEYGAPSRAGGAGGVGTPGPSAQSATARPPLRFDDLMAASPEMRQRTLMRIYFSRLLPRVVRRAEEAWVQNSSEGKHDAAGTPAALEATSVWCTLVFRMLCWLQLHDFNKTDVQLPKSELLGNRLSVYIW